jgi:hypothetical protein
MNKPNSKRSIKQIEEVKIHQNGLQDLFISIACISFFPAVYVIGKTIVSWIG